jgi:thioredoxin-dependent peroxiredoxin
MKRFIGMALVAAMTIATTVVLNLGLIAGYPWSDQIGGRWAPSRLRAPTRRLAVLTEGIVAPPFTLPDQHGEPVSLSELAGRWVVFWWFPKAFTGGWAREIQGFRDRAPEFDAAGITLIGASFDQPEDNRAFAETYGYGGTIVSDVERTVGAAYQTARPPDDPDAVFAKRRTFAIDPDGVIRKVYAVKDIEAHPGKVLDDLRELGAIEGAPP